MASYLAERNEHGLILNNILLSVIALAQTESLFAPITIGALPVNNGLCMAIGSGYDAEMYGNAASYSTISIVFNGKHNDQSVLLDALYRVHKRLTTNWNYPEGDGFQITAIETDAAPSYLDRDDNGMWLYGSALRVYYYRR